MSDHETMQRCAKRHPGLQSQCGLWAGHDGDHTVLIPSNVPWATHHAREESATPTAAEREGAERKPIEGVRVLTADDRDWICEHAVDFARSKDLLLADSNHAVLCYEKTVRDLESQLLAARRENEGVPGEWTCDKCGFGLSTRTLHATNGGISVRSVMETPTCPNDGKPLRSLSWREKAESQSEGIRDLLARAAAAEEDAERYRVLADAVGDQRIWVYENGFRQDEFIVGSLGLEALCARLRAQRDTKR